MSITPGSWSYTTTRSGRTAHIWSNGTYILELSKRKNPDMEDNARAIAALPELLAACKAALVQLAVIYGTKPELLATDTARALRTAIEKAEGK